MSFVCPRSARVTFINLTVVLFFDPLCVCGTEMSSEINIGIFPVSFRHSVTFRVRKPFFVGHFGTNYRVTFSIPRSSSKKEAQQLSKS